MAQDGGTSLYTGSVPRAVPRWNPGRPSMGCGSSDEPADLSEIRPNTLKQEKKGLSSPPPHPLPAPPPVLHSIHSSLFTVSSEDRLPISAGEEGDSLLIAMLQSASQCGRLLPPALY